MSEQNKDAERAAFEAWCLTIGYTLKPHDSDNGYKPGYGSELWSAWQARASLPVGVPSITPAMIEAGANEVIAPIATAGKKAEAVFRAMLAAAPTQGEQGDEAKRIDKQCRDDVAAALGFVRGDGHAWSYLLAQIKELVRVAEAAQPDAAPLATAAKPRLTGAVGGEFKFVAKWDGSDAHPTLNIQNGVFDMAGKSHIADLLIAISEWISEYAESIRATPMRTGIFESSGVSDNQE